jgi:hypothetical protein
LPKRRHTANDLAALTKPAINLSIFFILFRPS